MGPYEVCIPYRGRIATICTSRYKIKLCDDIYIDGTLVARDFPSAWRVTGVAEGSGGLAINMEIARVKVPQVVAVGVGGDSSWGLREFEAPALINVTALKAGDVLCVQSVQRPLSNFFALPAKSAGGAGAAEHAQPLAAPTPSEGVNLKRHGPPTPTRSNRRRVATACNSSGAAATAVAN